MSSASAAEKSRRHSFNLFHSLDFLTSRRDSTSATAKSTSAAVSATASSASTPASGRSAPHTARLSISSSSSSTDCQDKLLEVLSLRCPICRSAYDDVSSSHVPYLLSCAHTLCTVCAHAVTSLCPVCKVVATRLKENSALKQVVSDVKRLCLLEELCYSPQTHRRARLQYPSVRPTKLGCSGSYLGDLSASALSKWTDGGVCVHSADNLLFLADTVDSAILALRDEKNTAGKHVECSVLRQIGGGSGGVGGPLDEPRDVALDTINRLLYISDSGHHRVFALCLDENGEPSGVSAQFGSAEGRGPGQLRFPFGVAVDGTAGLLYVSGNSRICVFSTGTAAFLTTFGSGATTPRPLGICVDECHGVVYVVDGSLMCVQVWIRERSSEGFHHRLCCTFGSGGDGDVDGHFRAPTYLAYDSTAQLIYVSDCRRRESGDIQAFRSWNVDEKCSWSKSWKLNGNSTPGGIAVDSITGLVYVAASKPRGHVQVFQ